MYRTYYNQTNHALRVNSLNIFAMSEEELERSLKIGNSVNQNITRTVYQKIDWILPTAFYQAFHERISTPIAKALDEVEDFSYHTFRIPKKTGGFRVIEAPNDNLKEKQKDALRALKHLLPHDNAFAYFEGRSIKDALIRHQNNRSRWFLKIDLKDFFGSHTEEYIRRGMKKIYPIGTMSETAANSFLDPLIRLAVNEQGVLPQGTPISPHLTNILTVPFDYSLTKELYQMDKTYVYTRYADDIIISARHKFDWRAIIELIEDILKALDMPFEIHKDKTRFGSAAGRNWNLGLMYNKDLQITIGHRRKKRIRAGIHNYYQDTTAYSEEDLQVLLGEISYLQQIEPNYYNNNLRRVYPNIKMDIQEHLRRI